MQPCKAVMPDGKPCPNQADDGQDFCPHHLSEKDKHIKEIGGIVLGVVFMGLIALITGGKVSKS